MKSKAWFKRIYQFALTRDHGRGVEGPGPSTPPHQTVKRKPQVLNHALKTINGKVIRHEVKKIHARAQRNRFRSGEGTPLRHDPEPCLIMKSGRSSRGMGKPGFPIPPTRGQAWPRGRRSARCCSPRPRPRAGLALTQGCGETWFPHPPPGGRVWEGSALPGGVWGNRVSPRPRPRQGLALTQGMAKPPTTAIGGRARRGGRRRCS